MKLTKFLFVSLFMLTLTVFFTGTVFAQTPVLNTVYVNSTNGDDSYTGENPINNPAGTGPKQTIEGAFAAVKDGGTIYIDGGTYNIDGSARTDANSIQGGNDSDGITFSGGKSVTIVLRTYASFTTVTIPTGGLTINNGTKTITINATTSGVEGIDLSGGLTLTAGTLNVSGLGSKFVVNASTITRSNGTLVGTPAFSSSGNYNVTYSPTSAAITAGPELPADLNTGTLTIGGNKAVTINANVLLSDGKITTGTGTATFNGTVTFDAAATATNGIQITGSGSLTFGTVIIKSKAALGTSYINNANANGTLSISSLTLQNNSTSTSPANTSLTIANTGTATVGSITETKATVGTTDYTATVSIDNNGTKTFNLGASSISGTVNNNAGGTLNLTGNVTVGGALDNSSSTLKLNSYTLTLTGTGHNNNGGTITDTGGKLVFNKTAAIAVTGGGTFATTENANTGLVTISGSNTFTGNVISTKGGFTFSGAATLQKDLQVASGTVTFANAANSVKNIAQTGGTIDFTANTITVNGDINQSGGTFNYNAATVLLKGNLTRTGGTVTPGTGTLQFAGSTAQQFNAGANYQVNDLKITGTSTAVTFQSSLVVNGDATVDATNSFALGTNNIRMAGNNKTFTLNGSYTSSGGGGIIFQAPTGDQNISGSGVYSNIEVNLGDYTKHVIVTDETVKFSGILTTTSGGIQINTTGIGQTAEFNPVNTLTTPTIRVNLADNDGAANGTNDPKGTGVSLASGGGTETFNSTSTKYNLEYFGALDATSTQAVTAEYVVADLLSLTVNTSGGKLALPDADATMSGDLTVGPNAKLTIASSTQRTYTLDKDGGVYNIRGTIDFTANADILKITGANATINGISASTDPAFIDADVEINSTTKATVSGIKTFNQTVTTGTGSVVDFGMYYKATGDLEINGLLTIGGEFNLKSKIYADAGVTVNAGGSLNLGTYDIEVKNVNGTTFTTNEDVLSSGGKLYANGKTLTIDANGKDIPYVTVKGATTTLSSDLYVSKLLDIQTSGVIASGGNTITIADKIKTVDGATITGTGTVEFVGSTLEINDLGSSVVTWPNVTINSDTNKTTTITSTNGNPMTLEITGLLTQTIGNINQGDNDIKLTGSATVFTRVDGNIIQGDGALIFNGTANQNFTPSHAWTIKNLTIDNAGNTVSTSDSSFTVTGTLNLVAGDFSTTTEGLLHLAAGVTIAIDAASASLNGEVPTFDGPINVVYQTTAGSTSTELPTATDKLNNLTIKVNTTLSEDVTVNGTLILDAGTLDLTTNSKTLTLASGATLVRKNGSMDAAPSVTNYNLKYTANNNDAKEFVSGKVDLLTVEGATLTLQGNRTVKDVALVKANATNKIDLNGKNLTVTGNLNMSNGDITGTGNLILGGTTAQTFTVPAAGLALNADLKLDNAAGFTLTGGNLTINSNIIFVKGVLSTVDNVVILTQTTTGQGFDHSQVVAPNVSHINGNVRHSITAGAGSPTVYPNGRYEFPVGTSTQYRPFAITFTSSYPAINPTSVTVKMVDASPEGTNNLPLDAGNGLKIGSYAPYYWLVKTTPSSFTSTQLFDVELQGTNIGIPYTSDQSLRIIRRQDGTSTSNGWSLQAGSTYANYSIYNSPTDTTAVVRTTASIGGIVIEGTRFAIGVPSRVPKFTAPVSDTKNVNEDATETVQFTAVSLNANETISYSLVSGPTWATLNTTSGLLTLKPGYSDASTTPYQVVVRATANPTGLYVDYTLKVTVINKNQKPVFTASSLFTSKEIPYGTEFPWNFAATDADGETLKFMVTLTPAPAGTYSISNAAGNVGIFKFTPTFADLNKTFTLTLSVTDNIDTVTVSTPTIKVIGKYERGDANLSGGVADIDDAVAILKHVVQNPVLGAENLVYADANLDGVVNTLDASWILKFIQAGNDWTKVSKSTAAAGTVDFGKANNENGLYNLPISIANTKGVTSIYTEVEVNNGVEVKGISVRLPEGWISSSVVENGKVKFAAAGTNPLNDGVIANVQLKLENKEAVVSVVGNAKLNEEISASLNAKVREIPSEFAVSQNYPNPFNPTTTIKFAIANDARVNLVVYDMLGQKVRTLIDGEQEAGYYSVRWDGTNDFGSKVSSGIYIYRLQAGNFVKTMKMNLMK